MHITLRGQDYAKVLKQKVSVDGTLNINVCQWNYSVEKTKEITS